MINKLVKNNFDSVIACKDEKGSIFLKENSKINKIYDGEIPSEVRSQNAFVSRIGIGYVTRTSSLTKGNLLSGRVGNHFIDNNLEITEVNLKNCNKLLIDLIKMNYEKYK